MSKRKPLSSMTIQTKGISFLFSETLISLLIK